MSPAYSSDSVYLYSTLDSSTERSDGSHGSVLPPRSEAKLEETISPSTEISGSTFRRALLEQVDVLLDQNMDQFFAGAAGNGDEPMAVDEDGGASGSDSDEESNDGEEEDEEQPDQYASTPIIYPRRRFKGHCNVETVKDGTSLCHSSG